MKKFVFIIFCLVATARLWAQTDSINLDILRAPNTPGFTLLGIEPSNIETPTDATDVMVSLRNATNNFSALPRSYALDFMPAMVFAGKNISFNDYYINDNAGKNLWQTFRLSLATNTPQTAAGADSNLTMMGIGFKTSIIKGKLAKDDLDIFKNIDSTLYKIGLLYNNNNLEQNDSLMKVYDQMLQNLSTPAEINAILLLINARKQKLADSAQQIRNMTGDSATLNSLYRKYAQQASSLKLKRYGWKLDLAGGIVLDFPGQQFNYSLLTKYAGWLTGGYEFENNMGLLAVARGQLNPMQVYTKNDNTGMDTADVFFVDAGMKFEYSPFKKFTVSAEGVYRTAPSNSNITSTWRYVVNFGYSYSKNQIVNFSFGKNFDSPLQTGGNLVAAVNLLFGLGSNRPATTAAAP